MSELSREAYIQKLASDIDTFSYENDTYNYRDAFDTREEGLQQVMNVLAEGDTESVKNYLQEDFIDEEYEAEDAQSLIDRITFAEEQGYFPKPETNARYEQAKDAFGDMETASNSCEASYFEM